MKRATFIIGICIIVLAMVAFIRCLDYGLVNLDDYFYVLTHREVCDWKGWTSLKYFFVNVDECIWMPLTWLSYALDHLMYGDWYGGFHLTSVAVHFVNASLVWVLLEALFSAREDNTGFTRGACLFAALVWAVHPLRCESVVFIASRKDVLSFFWELLALICWVKGSTRNWRWTASATLFFVIGSMCKPSVMTFPLLCLFVDLFILRKVRILRYVVPVAYMLFLGGFAAWQQQAGGVATDLYNQPLWGRLLGACAAFGIYLRNFLWPFELAPQCIKTWPQWPRFAVPGLIVSGLWGWWLWHQTSGLWRRRREMFKVIRCDDLPVGIEIMSERNAALAGGAWFAVAIAPMLGIANFGFHAFADRFTYIPAVGLSILIVEGLLRLRAKVPKGRAILAGCGVVILVLAGVTWRQTGYWRDDRTLFSHTLEVDGDHNACAHGNLANWYFEFPHDLEKCVDSFENAIRTDIRHVVKCYEIYVFALCELGRTEDMQRKFDVFHDALRSMFGPERVSRICSGEQGLSDEESFYQNIYYCARIAWLIADKTTLPLAGETLNRFKGPAMEGDQIWQYLQWRYYLATGEQEKAEHYYNALTKPGRRSGYIQFRYMRNRSPERKEDSSR